MSSIHFNDMYTVGIFAAAAALGVAIARKSKKDKLRRTTQQEGLTYRILPGLSKPYCRTNSKPYVSKIDQMPAKTARQWARWGVAAGVAFVFARSLFSYN